MTTDGSGCDVTGDLQLDRVCLVNRPHTTAEGGKRALTSRREVSLFSARSKSGAVPGFVEFKVRRLKAIPVWGWLCCCETERLLEVRNSKELFGFVTFSKERGEGEEEKQR